MLNFNPPMEYPMRIIQVCLAVALSTMLTNSALADWQRLFGYVKSVAASDPEYTQDEIGHIWMKVFSIAGTSSGTCKDSGGQLILKIRPSEGGNSLYQAAMHAYSSNSLVEVGIDENHHLGRSDQPGAGQYCYLMRIRVADELQLEGDPQ